MKKFLLGALVGTLFSAAIFIPVLRWERQLSWQLGVDTGTISGQRLAADALEKEFGNHDGRTPSKVLYSVKTTDVVSIETNGVRTVRVIP